MFYKLKRGNKPLSSARKGLFRVLGPLFSKDIIQRSTLILVAFILITSSLASVTTLFLPASSASAVTAQDCPEGEYYPSSATNQGAAYCFGPKTCENEGGVFNTDNNTCGKSPVTVSVFDGLAPSDKAMSWIYYRALRHCMMNGAYVSSGGSLIGGVFVKNSHMSAPQAQSFDWFHGWNGITPPAIASPNLTEIGILADPTDDGILHCGDDEGEGKQWLQAMATLWGFSGPELLCTMGWTREVDNNNCSKIISGVNNDFHAPTDKSPVQHLDEFWTNRLGAESTELSSLNAGGGTYRLYLDSFTVGCKPVQPGSGEFGTVREFDPNLGDGGGWKDVKYGIADRDLGKDHSVLIYQLKNLTCAQLVESINSDDDEAVKGYATWLQSHPATDDTPSIDAQCEKGLCGDETTSCRIVGIGWIVCGVANFLAGVTDAVYGLIKDLLEIPPVNIDTTDGGNGVYNAWSIMRSIANVGFVIAFLIIIFSQMTGAGVSNYGVKKSLPRLVVAAVLVNLSYWVGALAVDLSNVIGSSIYDLLGSINDNMNVDVTSNWGNIIAGLLAGSAITAAAGVVAVGATVAIVGAGGGLALLFLALPLVLAAVLAVLVAALILIARQALVVVLIILSPLAFVALILPNTEKLFSQWRSALISVLVMYPIISIVFGGAQVAGFAIMSTASTGTDAALFIVVGQAVMVLPFFFIPTLILKFSGNNLSGLASTLMSKGKGLISGASGAARKQGMGRLGRAYKTVKYGKGTPRGSRVGGVMRRGGAWLDQVKDQQGNADKYLASQEAATTRERLSTDEAYATASAAGDVEGGRVLRLRAIASGKAEAEKEALEAITQANLSGSQRFTLAMNGKLTLADGTVLSGEAMQRTAVQEVFRAGSYEQQSAAIEASATGGALEKFAQTVSNGAASIASKDPAYSGSRLESIAQGGFHYEASVKAAITEGKYSTEPFASMNDEARERVIGVAQAAEIAGDPTFINILRESAAGITNSTSAKDKIAGNPTAATQINSLLPRADPPPTT